MIALAADDDPDPPRADAPGLVVLDDPELVRSDDEQAEHDAEVRRARIRTIRRVAEARRARARKRPWQII